jgi:hypothetical protein
MIVAGIIVLALIGAGISFLTRKGVEETIERGIEGSTNNDVDVDLDGNTIVANTNSGSVQIGENAEIPDSFPEDIYLIDGDVLAAIENTESSGYTITLTTNASASSVNDQYVEELPADGWTVTSTMNISGTYTLVAEKTNRTVSVTAGESDGTTSVSISTYTNSGE